MHVVTFYSFKGGVGRSMALVNVGYQLAKAGRRVLLVDFDLEAPGLPTFNLQQPARMPPGIIDYVHDYLTTGEAPSVADYIYKSETFENDGGLWVMPAGSPDDAYSARFQQINWQKLYDESNGFLLFEEMKEQWRTSIQPDYVLVDSRTGHTDIAGICTRQLPDAVCILFFPNEQNLAGLKRVVRDIRNERRGSPKTGAVDVALHFVVSNVPTLDDEDRIVATRLKSFKEQLSYDRLAAQIHHYDSLALVNQLVFSKERPNSYLAQEYGKLVNAIRKDNFEDRDTALDGMRRMVSGPRNPSAPTGSRAELTDEQLRQIAKTFPQDGEICFWLALSWRFYGDVEAALLLFNRAIENGYVSRDLYLERGTTYRQQRNVTAATEDFWRVLEDTAPAISGRETNAAVQLLLEFPPVDAERIASSWAVTHLSPDESQQLAFRISDSEIGLQVVKPVLSRVIGTVPNDSPTISSIRNALGLALIGLGDFEEAEQRLNPDLKPTPELEQEAAFNIAIAKWGASGQIAKSFFAHVLEMDRKQSRKSISANYFQCLAISYWALDNKEQAEQCLAESRRVIKSMFSREFSAWRYLRVHPTEFAIDLDELELMLKGQETRPRIIGRFSSRAARDALH